MLWRYSMMIRGRGYYTITTRYDKPACRHQSLAYRPARLKTVASLVFVLVFQFYNAPTLQPVARWQLSLFAMQAFRILRGFA